MAFRDYLASVIGAISPSFKGGTNPEAEGLGIQPAKNAKDLAAAWREKRLSAQSLAPGVAKTPSEHRREDPAERMCSPEAGAWLTAAFGPAKSVGFPGAAARMHAMEFRGKTILAIYQRERGVGWQVALGEAADPEMDGRSYGKPMLLSWDTEALDFWPDFCGLMSEGMAGDPLAFKALMQEREIAASTSPGSRRGAAPRV